MTLHTSPRASTAPRSGGQRTDTSRRRRVTEAVAFVATWMAAGHLLQLSSNAYLLLGIPLTFAFQLGVRRRPLRELFAGGTPRFALDRNGVAMGTVLAVTPGYYATEALTAGDWTTLGWYLAAIAGAFAAAFSLRASSIVATIRSAALPIAVGAGGMVAVFGAVHLATGRQLPAVAALAALVKYVALYYPATFLLEEVAFRGAIDAHVHHDRDTRGWQSAVFVSALWGLWHLPVSSGFPLPLMVVELVVVHVGIGVGLSSSWRRTRNLGGPALAHAVIDAVRNASMLGL
jgi:membrane protease YdiL (CAAX protease family)